MRTALVVQVVLCAAASHAAEDTQRIGGSLDGVRVTVSENRIEDGVQATIGLLGSCHDESPFRADELRRARQGDHVRLEFREPVDAEVMDERVEFSELVLRLPLNTGVFWVRSGDTWRRYAKFEFAKQQAFQVWLSGLRTAER